MASSKIKQINKLSTKMKQRKEYSINFSLSMISINNNKIKNRKNLQISHNLLCDFVYIYVYL